MTQAQFKLEGVGQKLILGKRGNIISGEAVDSIEFRNNLSSSFVEVKAKDPSTADSLTTKRHLDASISKTFELVESFALDTDLFTNNSDKNASSVIALGDSLFGDQSLVQSTFESTAPYSVLTFNDAFRAFKLEFNLQLIPPSDTNVELRLGAVLNENEVRTYPLLILNGTPQLISTTLPLIINTQPTLKICPTIMPGSNNKSFTITGSVELYRLKSQLI